MTSERGVRARAFVEDHLAEARGLGTALVELVDDPEAFVQAARSGLDRLADPDYADAQERVAPGSGAVLGVRWPLIRAVERQLAAGLREGSSSTAISLAQRLVAEPLREVRLLAVVCLRVALDHDPERAWQVLRRLVRASHDWISIDVLAELVAHGILREPFRWAELEQLVYSRSPWERRLVGSTLARLPHALPRRARSSLATSPGLPLVAALLGDDAPEVQKSLSWALRSWSEVDPDGIATFLRRESAVAAATDDGHRAWVLRDALSQPTLPTSLVRDVRRVLAPVRRRPGAPSTSRAAEASAALLGTAGDAAVDRTVGSQGERQRMTIRGAA